MKDIEKSTVEDIEPQGQVDPVDPVEKPIDEEPPGQVDPVDPVEKPVKGDSPFN